MLTGGARSGKSDYAEKLAKEGTPPVLYVATAQAYDEEMKSRIANHRAKRPKDWRTLEAPENIGQLIADDLNGAQTVIIDCVTVLTSNILCRLYEDKKSGPSDEQITDAVMVEIDNIIKCLKNQPANFIIVTNEVGLGLVPDNRMGRLYRDILGKANQNLAAACDKVLFMASGLSIELK